MSDLQWEFDGETWNASSVLTDEGSPFFWRINVGDDGMFSLSESDSELLPPKSRHWTLSEAKSQCQQREMQIITERKAAEGVTIESGVHITGPCMGRTRNGFEVVLQRGIDETFPYYFRCHNGQPRSVTANGFTFADGQRGRYDIVEIWPLPEDESVEGEGVFAPISDGGPAFPFSSNHVPGLADCQGMSLRDVFAKAAICGLLACDENPSCESKTPEGIEAERVEYANDLAVAAYRFADAMLKARGQ